jgi:hypothetical protein
MTMLPWFNVGYFSIEGGPRFPVATVARDETYGLIIYERLPINISVEEGLRRSQSRYYEGKLADFQPLAVSSPD